MKINNPWIQKQNLIIRQNFNQTIFLFAKRTTFVGQQYRVLGLKMLTKSNKNEPTKTQSYHLAGTFSEKTEKESMYLN